MGAMVLFAENRTPQEAKAESFAGFSFRLPGEASGLRNKLEATQGELDLAKAQIDRLNKVLRYSAKYRISADLASSILDISQAEGIEPELGFRVVNVESQFNEHAVSPVGAVGLMQLMPATARYFQPGITKEGLYDANTNLRVGFRYLRTLIREYDGNLHLALLAYNGGPQMAARAEANPSSAPNRYDRLVLAGYSGTGTVN